ncbi:MAG: hypothetical protein HYW65_04215 [Candidatus Liptonbacteria bacterium]|nr:hypothetical protein [Candidatus Liptonbacteria bacterium]
MQMRGARGGFYMVEAMAAMGLLVFGFLGMLTLLANSLSLNRVVADTYVANYLAMEGIELAKNTIDANVAYKLNLNRNCEWDEGFEDPGSYEVDWTLAPASPRCPGAVFVQTPARGRFLGFDPSTGKYRYGAPEATPFKRRIEITPDTTGRTNGNEVRVNSIVEWTTRGGGSFTVNVEDFFYNWARR